MVVASDFDDTFDNDITTRSSGSESQNSPSEPQQTSASIFSLKYYQKFFDVDTEIVIDRILSLTMPNRAAGAMEKISKNPDLYGPFWIVVTTVFAIAVSGNVADFLHHHGENHKWHYNFHLMSYAATIIISYVILVPLTIWAVLQWTPKHEGNQMIDGEEVTGEQPQQISVLALICSYGYSLAIYIPVSILWTIQISFFQWILMVSAATCSGLSLLVTIRPSLTKSKYGFALTVGVVAMHILLAAGLMVYFFHDSTSQPIEKVVPAPAPVVPGTQNNQTN